MSGRADGSPTSAHRLPSAARRFLPRPPPPAASPRRSPSPPQGGGAMGFGEDSFWDLLKPYARHEGPGFLRGRRVAVDLSSWIVSPSTAIPARNPHLRTTFFRTISLFAKMGAFPVFVLYGEPSPPLKSQARAARFFRSTGVDLAALPATDAASEPSTAAASPVKARNAAFTTCVEECVELLQYLGMPVLRAKGEAEALCAQLNREGHVDACITADSDAFLYGARTVIKALQSNCKEPFECYNMADIESGLGLKRNQMIAMALLIGSDHVGCPVLVLRLRFSLFSYSMKMTYWISSMKLVEVFIPLWNDLTSHILMISDHSQ